MKEQLSACIVSGVLVALFIGLPAVTGAQHLTVSGYADFEVVAHDGDNNLIDVAPAQTPPAEAFAARCAACHGAGGAGDGIASVAYDPKPTNFTDPAWAESRTPAEIETLIAEGVNLMPAYAEALSADEITAMAAYLLAMSSTP